MFFLFANLCVCFNTKLYKNIPNVDFMAILMKLATCHIRNAFKRPLRPNAPTVRVLTSVILKVIGWAFRKSYPTKIPSMVHQGLLAPQRLLAFVQSRNFLKTRLKFLVPLSIFVFSRFFCLFSADFSVCFQQSYC